VIAVTVYGDPSAAAKLDLSQAKPAATDTDADRLDAQYKDQLDAF
jgi:hypothetical protein